MTPVAPGTLGTIDDRFAPRVHPAVATVILDGRAVLYHQESGDLIELDELATTMWTCFDGTLVVAELARQLARGSDVDPTAIRADLVGFCRDLACSDLLDGIILDPPVVLDGDAHPDDDTDFADRVGVDEIDLRFVPRPHHQVVTREVAGQALLLDAASGTVCALDPLASVIWRCFDGHGDLAALVGELAAVSDGRPEVVADDVLDLTTDLATLGLLDGVAPARTGDQPGGPSIGEALDLTGCHDLDEVPVVDDRLAAGSLLVVNWNPACGYCAAVAPELATLVAPLADQAIALVLLTSGGPEANRALLQATGLSCVVLQPGHVEPEAFAGVGTPVACLVERGRVASPGAYGGGEVLALARRAAGWAQTDPGTGSGEVRYLRDGTTGLCHLDGRSRPRRTWADTITCRVGDYHMGVRTDSPAAASLVRRGLGDRCREPDPRAPANYSVVLGDPADGRARDLRLLLAGDTPVVRSRSPRRILLALASHLSSWLAAESEGLVATTSLAVVSGDQAVLLPPSTAAWRDRLQPRLARLGYAFVDQRLALVDPVRAELVVPEPRITVDSDVLDGLADAPISRFEPAVVPPGRYRLRAWTTRLGHPDHEAPASAAALVAAVLETIDVEPGELDRTAGTMLDLFERVALVALDEARADQLVARVAELGA